MKFKFSTSRSSWSYSLASISLLIWLWKEWLVAIPWSQACPYTFPGGSLCNRWLLSPCQPFEMVPSSLAQLRCFPLRTLSLRIPVLCPWSWCLCPYVLRTLKRLLKGRSTLCLYRQPQAPCLEWSVCLVSTCPVDWDERQGVERRERRSCYVSPFATRDVYIKSP